MDMVREGITGVQTRLIYTNDNLTKVQRIASAKLEHLRGSFGFHFLSLTYSTRGKKLSRCRREFLQTLYGCPVILSQHVFLQTLIDPPRSLLCDLSLFFLNVFLSFLHSVSYICQTFLSAPCSSSCTKLLSVTSKASSVYTSTFLVHYFSCPA